MARWAVLTIALVGCGGSGDGPAGDAPASGEAPRDGAIRDGAVGDGAIGDGPRGDAAASDAPAGDGPLPVDAAGGIGEPADLAGIVAAHNQVRAMVDTPTALPPLVWSATLAATAATWVAACVDSNRDGLVDHNDNRSAGHPFYVGENIYASSGTARAAAAVTAWASEGTHYHYADNTCDAGSCGHYTQLVWRATLQVGCALHRCDGLMYPSTIVCDYGPGGNIGTQKPY